MYHYSTSVFLYFKTIQKKYWLNHEEDHLKKAYYYSWSVTLYWCFLIKLLNPTILTTAALILAMEEELFSSICRDLMEGSETTRSKACDGFRLQKKSGSSIWCKYYPLSTVRGGSFQPVLLFKTRIQKQRHPRVIIVYINLEP